MTSSLFPLAKAGVRSKLTLTLLLALMIAGLAVFCANLSSDENKLPVMAPVSKAFVDYQNRQAIQIKFTAEGYPLGWIPDIHDFSYLRFSQPLRLKALPPVYDLRTQNKLTPVKNQGACGSCWAFATFGSLESYLMPNEIKDFSEENLIDHHGLDYGPCDGGNWTMAMAYLARWDGPVDESADPYLHADPQPVKHVQESILIPGRTSSLDNDLIKQMVMTYGAVYTSMYWVSSFYNSTYKSYYNTGTAEGGHAVAIVGWDDNFEASKFNSTPPGNGAFIVRNSWGGTWGESGYFYVSYYDAYFARSSSAVIKGENVNNYQAIYQYDPLGWVSTWGYSQETGWLANIFQATENLPIKAVGFYNPGINANYELYVYKNVTPGQPRSGTLATSKSGTLSLPGFYTVTLDQSVPVTTGQNFSVVLKLTTPGRNYQICAEGRYAGYSSNAVSNPGKSFISSDGNSWFDFGSYDPDGDGQGWDVCLKAYAGLDPIYPPLNLNLTRLENNLIFFKEKINRLTWSANPANTVPLTAYKIYRKGRTDSTFVLVGTVGPNQLTYDDRALRNPTDYSYQVTAVDAYNRESDPAVVLSGSATVLKDKQPRSYRGKISTLALTDKN
ncbi:MAG: lectin like domain-containing protein [Candidatus Saccharicenans sp.]